MDFLIAITCLLASEASLAQKKCEVKQLPYMFVNKDESIARAKQFTNGSLFKRSKYGHLSRVTKKEPISIDYPRKSFETLLSLMATQNANYGSVQVYLGSFDNRYNEGITDLPDHKLMLIYAAFTTDGDGLKARYYFIRASDGKVFRIKYATALYWISWFEDHKKEVLRESIRDYDDDKYNYLGKDISNRDGFSDTKSVNFTKKQFEENFTEEFAYQECMNKDTVTGIRVNFASFTKDGKLVDGETHFRKRLVVLFEYLIRDAAGKNKILYIDEQPDISERRKRPVRILEREASDNGQLCPPNCPPPPPDPDGIR